MLNWFENHQPQRTKISTVCNTSYIQNSSQMASSVIRNQKFSERILSTPARQHPSFSAHKAVLMTKTDLMFTVFPLRFVDFAVQFCLRCKFSFHEKLFKSSMTLAWFLWTNHNSLLRKATNEIASFWINNRLRQRALSLVLDFSSPEFFSRPFRLFPAPTNCPCVSEDGQRSAFE